MKGIVTTFISIILSIALFSQGNIYFTTSPTLTPDGQTVIFAFEGDLWKANVNDGQATRLTAMQGYETTPRVSPDGKWIAFNSNQYGNTDVFVVPVNGGEVRQITWHSGTDDVCGWSWDSKFIYLNSTRLSRFAGYKVSVDGGTPQRVFGDYFFQYDHDLVEHPVTGEIFFDDSWESINQSQRKRYKGPFNPEIQSYNLKTSQHKKYTNWEGKDFGTSIDRNGNIYFISDEANGEYNLYTLDNGKKKALTKFTTSIKTPQVNANGGKVVFEKDYQLWLYDVRSEKSSKLNISIIRNYVLPKEKDFEVKGNIDAFDVSPDGKKMVFVSRGEIFVSDIEGKFIKEIDRRSTEAVSEVKWMSDNKTILFTQTSEGYTNLYTIRADSTETPVQLTSDKRNNRSLTMNKKRTMAVYLSGRDEIRLIDLKTLKPKTVVKDEIWAFQNSDPGFSPNDEYILFTAYRNFEQDILVYNIKENKSTNLTNTGVTETSPIWSGDGKYIYFTTDRLKPAYPTGMSDAKVYRVALEKFDDPYRIDKYNELFKETKKDTTKKAEKKDSVISVSIDTDRILERFEQISPNAGTQGLRYVYQKDDKTYVIFSSNHGEGRSALWKTVIEPFEQTKTEKIAGTDNASGLSIVEVSNKLYALFNSGIYKLNLEGNKVEPISISYTFRRNLKDEFKQVFYQAWAQMEEGYYDENFHG